MQLTEYERRELQIKRAKFIANAVAAITYNCPPIGELIATIHLALNATEPTREPQILRDALADYQVQLDRMAEQLRSKVQPGHVDYINKTEASGWAQAISREMGHLVETVHIALDATEAGL